MSSESGIVRRVTCQRFSELWLHVLYNCNLNCKHCLFSCAPGQETEGELTLEECRRHTLSGLDLGVQALYITGGEPLLWPFFEDFVSWYYQRDQVVPLTVLTNGTLIDSRMASFIKKYSSQGLNIRVSLECYTRDNHDQYRGEGSFKRAVAGIKNLNREGIRPWVAFVNKSGGDMDQQAAAALEKDFRNRLDQDFNVEISGLKIIAAYSKGRFSGAVNPRVDCEQFSQRLGTVQCNYTLAVSKDGIFPCPVLVDVADARLPGEMRQVLEREFSVDYPICNSCFATGTSCG